MKEVLVALVVAVMCSQPVAADEWDALRADAQLQEALVQFTMGRRIYKRCDSISARRLRVISFLNGLIRQAESNGYSRAEVDAYIDDETEQDRIAALADARLAERGASPENMAGYCTVGQQEISGGTTIGRLLR